MLLSFSGFAQERVRKVASEPPFRSNPEKGLYVGSADASDVLLGQHRALAMALIEYAHYEKPVTVKISSTSMFDNEMTAANEGSCDVEIVDRIINEGTEFIRFRITSGSTYSYSISDQMMSQEKGDESITDMESMITLSFKDPSGSEELLWEYVAQYLLEEKGNVVVSDHTIIASCITYAEQ